MRLSAPIFRLKRQAKVLARSEDIPLHQALDRIAAQEGFQNWGQLSARMAAERPAPRILAALRPGELLLVAARPEQGKTILALDIAVEAAKRGRPSHFFTLDMTEADVRARLEDGAAVAVDATDDICAAHVIAALSAAPGPALAVIDYLQLLDQRRSNPPLGAQVPDLQRFAKATGANIVLISQIDRAFLGAGKTMPDLSDIRLPNPVDPTHFDRTCFLHDGVIQFDRAA